MNTEFIIMLMLSIAVVFKFTALIVFFLSTANYKRESESKQLEYKRKLVYQLLLTLNK